MSNNNGSNRKVYTIKFFKKTLGIDPGIYNVTQSKKGYRLWLRKGIWIGLPKGIVELNPKLFREKKFNHV
jgi:hypothetical protein